MPRPRPWPRLSAKAMAIAMDMCTDAIDRRLDGWDKQLFGYNVLRFFLDYVFQAMVICILSLVITVVAVPNLSSSAGWTRASDTWIPIAWGIAAMELTVLAAFSVAQMLTLGINNNEQWKSWRRTKQLATLSILWWVLAVLLTGVV